MLRQVGQPARARRARRRARARAGVRPRRPRRTSEPGRGPRAAPRKRASASAPTVEPASVQIGWYTACTTSSSIACRTRSSRRRERSSLRRRACSSPASSSITPPVTSAERLPWPRAARSMDVRMVSRELPFTRYPSAPASSISSIVSRSFSADSASTRVLGEQRLMPRAAIAPPPAMWTSSTATAGFSRIETRIACAASATASASSSVGSALTSSASAARASGSPPRSARGSACRSCRAAVRLAVCQRGSQASTVVPAPGADSTRRLPPPRRTRARMLANP